MSLESKQAERGVGGLYDLAAALLTLARRQPHHRAERCNLARRWPIPKGVQRGGGRRGGEGVQTGAAKGDKRGGSVKHITSLKNDLEFYEYIPFPKNEDGFLISE